MPTPDLLHVTAEPLEDARLIRAAGEIDTSTIDALRRELDAAREKRVTALLDLSGVTFVDSSGLHLLLEASRASARSDWAFFIVRPSAVVQRLIEISATSELLMVVDPSAARAVASNAPKARPRSVDAEPGIAYLRGAGGRKTVTDPHFDNFR